MGGTSPFLGNPGPAFDPKAPAPEPGPTDAAGGADLHLLPPPPDEWQEESVRAVLRAKGSVIHAVAGVAQDDWLYTDADLQAIAPPLTRILNRYDATRAAAGTADELAVMIGVGGYVSRSWRTRRAVLAAERELPPEPASGVAAPAGTGPPAASSPPAAAASTATDFGELESLDTGEEPWQRT